MFCFELILLFFSFTKVYIWFFCFVFVKIRLHYFAQKDSFACGPASLRMIFKHLGVDMDEKRLEKLMDSKAGVGTSHHNLIEEVEREGFKHFDKKEGEVDEILKFLDDGYPVLVNYFNPLGKVGHFSVVVGYDLKDEVLILADPANGNDYCLKFEEFKDLWHNSNNTLKGWFMVVFREKLSF